MLVADPVAMKAHCWLTYAVADLRFLRFAGFPAWIMWALVHIYFLIGFANVVSNK